ncbi:SMI1/KNR4 family protein [Nocardia stercoris]|uniref:SMI1/KNR4 family protein n=1 Tax=Nocardia stercoris TaxID=2483361 RepID=A0A3M2LAY1_9NOCA|nr:SMI1/KNR4 family protein [Nocardia stercoris]
MDHGGKLALPEALVAVAAVGFECEYDDETDDVVGCDFGIYEDFEPAERTAWWYRLWTANEEVDGSEFRFFGTSDAGDYTGFWLVRGAVPIERQPVVYLGSEGQRGVVARDLADLLWLFAAGYGPSEAVEGVDESWTPQPDARLRAIAERYAPGREGSPQQILAAAAAEFPHFSEFIDAQCR